MAANVAANTTLSFVLRAAQLALALIVMGTDGYGKETCPPHSVEASSRLISSSSYSLVPWLHSTRRYRLRQFLRHGRRAKFMGFLDVLRCMDISGRHLPPHHRT